MMETHMDLQTKMFSGRKLSLHVYAAMEEYHRVDVDMLPEEALRLLTRIEACRREAHRDERLAFKAFDDRDYRLGWDLPVRDVELHIHPDGIAWRFAVSVEEGTETIATKVLERDKLLAALLECAHPEAFRLEFREVAKISAAVSLDALEEWLELDARHYSRTTIVPVTAEDVSTILSNAEDPDVRKRAMLALARLNPEEDDEPKSDAA